MNRETWNIIKNSKNFNVRVYRRGVTVLIGSLVLNFVLGILIFYQHLKLPERDYYATSGVTPPILLKPMLTRNYKPVALLDPDPPIDNVEKVIPQ